MQRDVHDYLPPRVIENMKKRSHEEAFGSEAADIVKGEKRLRLDPSVLEKATKFNSIVNEYMQGITTVKQHKPEYTELKPDSNVLQELNAKPKSWIGLAIQKAKLIPVAQKTQLEEISEKSQENNTTH